MQLEGRRRSANVEDRRSGGLGKGALLALPAGCGTVLTLGLGAVLLLLGVEPREVLRIVQDPQLQRAIDQLEAQPGMSQGQEDGLADFASAVLADTEDTWGQLFAERGGHYEAPVLVLFSGSVRSACGAAGAEVGPFYCPGDHKAYIDLTFFDDLEHRYGAPGDFAQAYVLAHEIGHHVQTITGISGEVRQAQRGLSQVEANALSVKLELQADCYAGVWGHHAARKGLLSEGDMREGLTAASAIGDDRLQRQARGTVTPESFTHGSSEQRTRWLRIGLESGAPEACDTFTP